MDFDQRFALDHEHEPHLEHLVNSPFVTGFPSDEPPDGSWHEHPAWTTTSRGLEMSLRRLAILDAMYRLAAEPLTSGTLRLPTKHPVAGLRGGGWLVLGERQA